MKRILIAGILFILLSVAGATGLYFHLKSSLPQLIKVTDYRPLLVSEVYDRNGKKIDEFFRERRTLISYDKIPKDLINAFLAAEDDQFFSHSGINYLAILRAAIANLRAGHTVQGGSTITQQVAKTFFLSNERTLFRKIKEAMLSLELEKHLSKEDIIYLYLNQIFFGQGAYGIVNAAETYFRKPVDRLTVAEMAILAGLPKAPSAYNPIRNPPRAKERQIYVLRRMAEVGFITLEAAEKYANEPVKIFLREQFSANAPYFTETVRLLLKDSLGENAILDEGLKIYTSLDLNAQLKAQEAMVSGLKELDKRQGFRGPLRNTVEPKEVGQFLLDTRNKLIENILTEKILQPDGHFVDFGPLNLQYDMNQGLPFYIKPGQTTEAIVSKVDDEQGLVFVRLAELEGVIDFETMKWARKPNPDKRFDKDQIILPSQALKMGDIILVKLMGTTFNTDALETRLAKQKKVITPTFDFKKYVEVELDQDPIAQGGLLSFDQNTGDIVAMVGGYNYSTSKFNRTWQAARQTGSSFKSIVYAAAMDKGYTPAKPVMDAPIVYEEKVSVEDEEGQEDTKVWKPANHSKSFSGDIIFRNALVQSLNIPTVRIVQDIGVNWVMDYCRRLGVFSPLNPDFTIGLGSSSLTLYEMTKIFSIFGKMGKKINPIIVKKVKNSSGDTLLENLSLDEKFKTQLSEIETTLEERRKAYLEFLSSAQSNLEPVATPTDAAETNDPFKNKTEPHIFFEDANQLLKPTTAYLITSLLKAAIEDKHGTGGRARALGREVAGKTGTSNGYYDAWFMGYTPQITTGVWVGFDDQSTLGKGEVGGRAALPIWLEYMKAAHENLPPAAFPVPDGIMFANIDSETGELATTNSKSVVRQAFLDGTAPLPKENQNNDSNFYKEDLSQ